ncbi:MAG: dinitrogenase iron-molybdenum cofactor biosynthesis protein [Anaerolineales bacterium]|nr:dinitrogenase iron-molybdenum cofactor biosynthesis protein [Anaerolineales bacterium]
MKIAAVTNDGQTISAHFGRAPHYPFVTVDAGQITARQQRDKAGHPHCHGEHDHPHDHRPEYHNGGPERHARMIAAITDCEVVLTRGMGSGMYANLQQTGIRPILTTVANIDEAIAAHLAGHLEDHPERLHQLQDGSRR